jgi:hypothetical protein
VFLGKEKNIAVPLCLFFRSVGKTEEGGGVEGVLLLFWNCFGGGCVGRGGRQGWGEIIAVSIRTRKKIRR